MLPEKKTHIASAAMKDLWQEPYPAIVKKRAKKLQISSKELRELSLAGLKKLAKKNFYQMIKHHHPDTRERRKSNFGETPLFKQLLNTHHFFSNLTEKKFNKFRQKEKEDKEWESSQGRDYFLRPRKPIPTPDGFQLVL